MKIENRDVATETFLGLIYCNVKSYFTPNKNRKNLVNREILKTKLTILENHRDRNNDIYIIPTLPSVADS